MHSIKKNLLFILSICLFSIIGECQVTIDTMYSTNNFCSFLKVAGDRLAWRETIDGQRVIILLEDNALDTILPPEGTEMQFFDLSETVVSWNGLKIDRPSSGHCSQWVETALTYYNQEIYTDYLDCANSVIGNNKYIVRTHRHYGTIPFQVINSENQVIFEMPEIYQGYELRSSNIFAISGEDILIKSFVYNAPNGIESYVFKFNINTLELTLLFDDESGCFTHFQREVQGSNNLAISSNCEEETNLFLHKDGELTLAASTPGFFSFYNAFNDGIVYYSTDDRQLIYNQLEGKLDTLAPSNITGSSLLTSTNVSGCYYTFRSRISGYHIYSIFNGININSISVPYNPDQNSEISAYFYAQSDNVIYDFVHHDGVYNLLKIEFDSECEASLSCALSYEHGPTDLPYRTKRCLFQPEIDMEVRDSEAFYIDKLVKGRKYEISFCEGYSPDIFEARVIIQEYDAEREIVGDIIHDSLGCKHEFRLDQSSSFEDVLIIVSNSQNCNATSENLANGKVSFKCGIGRELPAGENITYPETALQSYTPIVYVDPKPSNNTLSLNIENPDGYEVIISNFKGATLIKDINTNKIDLQGLESGYYFATINNKSIGINQVEKFLVLNN